MSAILFPSTIPDMITSSSAKPHDEQAPGSSSPTTNGISSRIPVPNSPTPFRRSASLRLKNEPHSSTCPPSAASNRFSSRSVATAGRVGQQDERHHHRRQDESSNALPLKRGKSFMERGERGGGGGGVSRHGAGPPAALRPINLLQELAAPTTESRGLRSGLPKGQPLTPQSPARIRSLSLSLSNTRLNSPRSPSTATAFTGSPRTPPTSPDVKNYSSGNLDWETDSITSLTSVTSVSSCDHASVARNGTTFSGRSMKYVFHCNQHAGATGEDYLTPTQRVHRQVKKLKYLLYQARKDLEEKDSDILKLTKEVVELRLYKAALNSPEDKSNSSEAVTVLENTEDQIIMPDNLDGDSARDLNNVEMNSSYSDSGHFDDFSSKDETKTNFRRDCEDKAVNVSLPASQDAEHSQLIVEYEKRLQELVRTHEEETYQLKQKHNDKVEELLQRITEINARYWQLVPELELAKEKIKELESQLEEACKKLEQQEEQHKLTHLDMYNQGHEAASRSERESYLQQGPSRISVPELLDELQVTKNELENLKAMYRQLMDAKNKSKIDPEITLQFLKSAVYYFLTDKENSQGHLKAIQSILGFSSSEISNIEKARLS